MNAMPKERTDYDQGKIDGFVEVQQFLFSLKNKAEDVFDYVDELDNWLIERCNEIDEF